MPTGRQTWYAIKHATEDNRWWMFDPTHTFDGGWTRNADLASRVESRQYAEMWSARVGGEVVEVE